MRDAGAMVMPGRWLLWVAMLGVAGSLYWTAPASAYVYWGEYSTIGRANLDGTNVNREFISSANIGYLAVDRHAIYWTNGNSYGVGMANLDGSDVMVREMEDVDYIAAGEGHVYVVRGFHNQYSQCGGSDTLESVFDPATFGFSYDGDDGAVAVGGGRIYWSTSTGYGLNCPSTSGIWSASLDGAGEHVLLIPVYTRGLAVDGAHIYWTDSVTNSIGRASLSGSEVNQNFITGADSPAGVAVDGAHIYWANNGSDTIGRANLDGSGVNQRFITGVNSPIGVAVDPGMSYAHGGKASPGPPVIKQISPSGGAYSRATEVTLRGDGFRPRSKIYRDGKRIHARDVRFVSNTEIRVHMPRVRMDQSGQQTITVKTGNQTSNCGDPNQIACKDHFNYYVPQIGALVYYTSASDPQKGFPGYGSCTATVVKSRNQNTILTASHCVFDEGAPSKDLYFAPGYYGWLNVEACQNKYSSSKIPPPPAGSAKAIFACGTAPYGVWKLKAYWTDSNNFTESNYDYAYAHVEERPGTSLERAVGGGLPISFCPGQKESKHFMAGCDGGSGESFRWSAYGEPQLQEGSSARTTTHLVHCGPSLVQHGNLGGPGPDAIGMACSELKPGASGGPWIDQNGDVGAVNHSCCQNIQDPTNTSATPNVTGAYLGKNAENRWKDVQGKSYLCTNQTFCSWKP